MLPCLPSNVSAPTACLPFLKVKMLSVCLYLAYLPMSVPMPVFKCQCADGPTACLPFFKSKNVKDVKRKSLNLPFLLTYPQFYLPAYLFRCKRHHVQSYHELFTFFLTFLSINMVFKRDGCLPFFMSNGPHVVMIYLLTRLCFKNSFYLHFK